MKNPVTTGRFERPRTSANAGCRLRRFRVQIPGAHVSAGQRGCGRPTRWRFGGSGSQMGSHSARPWLPCTSEAVSLMNRSHAPADATSIDAKWEPESAGCHGRKTAVVAPPVDPPAGGAGANPRASTGPRRCGHTVPDPTRVPTRCPPVGTETRAIRGLGLRAFLS